MRGVDPRTLSLLVCDRVNQELPPELRVRENGGQLMFVRDGELQEQLSFVSVFDSRPWQEAAEGAIWKLLDALQDFMIEATGVNTWPAASGFGGLAGVLITEDQIEFWYGEAASPTLRFAPIRTVGTE
jgi:hypothetical protein